MNNQLLDVVQANFVENNLRLDDLQKKLTDILDVLDKVIENLSNHEKAL